MFQLIYSITITSFWIWLLLLIFIPFIFQNENTYHFVINEICSTNTTTINKHGVLKNIGKFGKLICGLLNGFMYWRSIKFVKKRSKEKSKPPVIIGRFQRNIMTYSDTINLYMLLQIGTSKFSLYHLFNFCGISLHPLTLSLVRNIFICALVGVVFPAYIIFKLHKQIPNFLSVSNSVTKDTRHFYQRPPSLSLIHI